LTLPLSGWQLIEASAGTGKTWTLAALYVRLVLGHAGAGQPLGAGLQPAQILVMTFTDAATAELRQRIRQRLAQAALFFRQRDAGDAFLQHLGAPIAPAQWPLCAQRLDLAAQSMDCAAIFTIHGWSRRMLQSHAFDSASLFTQELVMDAAQLKRQAAQDYWRRWFYALDAQALGALAALGDTPEALLARLQPLWDLAERDPAQPLRAAPAPTEVIEQWRTWAQQGAALQAQARAAFSAAAAQAVCDAGYARQIKNLRSPTLDKHLVALHVWAAGADLPDDALAFFAASALQAKGWAQAADWPLFTALGAWHQHQQAQPQVLEAVLAHAAFEVGHAYQQAKAQAAQFDFSDLLQKLYHALHASDGRLAQTVASQYPVALVDEFQDTDPWQFGALEKIYSKQRNIHGGLILIGDPKQAIYGFRGADLATYLQARQQVAGLHTLAGNFRSTAGVVAAVNRVFGQASAPFGSVPYQPVVAANPAVQPLCVQGAVQPALTVWHFDDADCTTKECLTDALAQVCASQMVALLNAGAARPAQMAVLVRDRHEAAAVRGALAVRGVRSVYLSERSSVFASEQALDMWRILRAVANPGAAALVRAALATSTWGLSWDALAALNGDEAAWEAQVEQFVQWQRVWRTQGVLPMLHRLLHDSALAPRLLARAEGGERVLTNLLHLGELLQAASQQVQGERGLLGYLQDQLRDPSASGEAAQLRLESDAELVQVVTLHKSKGLEYPLVFLPFAAHFKAEKPGGRSDAERLDEDVRLLYVGLTRARSALWLGAASPHGDVAGKNPVVKSALSKLLGRQSPGDMAACLQRWASAEVVVQPAPAPTVDVYHSPPSTAAFAPARSAQRRLQAVAWRASFSALVRGLEGGVGADTPALAPQWLAEVAEPVASSPEPVAESEGDQRRWDAAWDAMPRPPKAGAPALPAATGPLQIAEPAPPAFDDFPAGSAYGSLLHDALQWQAEHGWPAARCALPEGLVVGGAGEGAESLPNPWAGTAWSAALDAAARGLGLSPQALHTLHAWVVQICKQNMPIALVDKALVAMQNIAYDALSLGQLQARQYWPEMAFALPLPRTSAQALDAVITRHLWPAQPRAALPERSLQGLLSGFMDLVLQHQGRYWVLDYKSNRLAGYAPELLQQAMLHHRYDVQASLYTLALHRLLRARLHGYDPQRHLGGALYWFVRGLHEPGAGLLTLPAPPALLDELDACLAETPQPPQAAGARSANPKEPA
jgi:exodeoxyribonuclease V beta subunit